MQTSKPLTMADAETRLVSVHGFERKAARELLREMRDHAATRFDRKLGAQHDEPTFSIDYSLTGARYGRGHFTFMED